MAYYKDLEEIENTVLVTIGWLEHGKPYSQGDVSEAFYDKLTDLLVNPWQPYGTCGVHKCDFCRFTGHMTGLSYKGKNMRMGDLNLFVPNNSILFVSPSLIAHYIDAHGYAPPEEYQDAVMKCPQMRSMDYLRSITNTGYKGQVFV